MRVHSAARSIPLKVFILAAAAVLFLANIAFGQTARQSAAQKCQQNEHADLKISACTDLIFRDTGDAAAYFHRAAAHQMKNQLAAALMDYDKAVQLNPEFRDAYSRRGDVHQALGNQNEAASDRRKVIEIGEKLELARREEAKREEARREEEKREAARRTAAARSDYEFAERLNSKEGWNLFLQRHAEGFYADLARQQLAKLDAASKSAKPQTQPPPQSPAPAQKAAAPQPKSAPAAQGEQQVYCDGRGCRPVPSNCRIAPRGTGQVLVTAGDQLICN